MKILIITQGIWSPKLGAVKVHIDLMEEYIRAGHSVQKLSLSDIYPNGENFFTKVVGKLYTHYIFKYLKSNANKFDVIDANYSCVVYPKNTFNFKGLLFCRSQGIAPVYKAAEESIPEYREALEALEKKKGFKTFLGNIYRSLQKKSGENEFLDSVKYADVVHCHNDAELRYFKSIGVDKAKIVVGPNGIPDDFIEKANTLINNANSRVLVFVASWTLRKGIADINGILKGINADLWDQIYLIGGHTDLNIVLQSFDDEFHSKIEVVPTYNKNDLFSILNKCKVAIFPSYVEGFPLSIIELLAFGLPIISYRVPGSAEALSTFKDLFLVEAGDKNALSEKVSQILRMSKDEYNQVTQVCKKVSQTYKLSKVAQLYLDIFKERMP